VTSGIQTQLNSKQATISNATSTEIGYLSGVTSAIQTQLDSKQSGGLTVPTTPALLTSVSDVSQFTLSKRPISDVPVLTSSIVPRIYTPSSTSQPVNSGQVLSIQADTIKIAASKVIGTNDGDTVNGSQVNGLNIGPSGTSIKGPLTFDYFQNVDFPGGTVTADTFGYGSSFGASIFRGDVNTDNISHRTSSSTINIGGNSTTKINIGNTNCAVDILGTTTYYNVNQLQVKDQLITLNKGGNTVTGAGSGIEINELFSVRQSANMLSANTNQLELQFPSGVTDNTQFMFFSTSGFSGVTGISTNTVYAWKLVSSKYIVHYSDGSVPITVGGTIPLSLTPVILLIKTGGGVETSTGYVKTSSDRDSWLFKAPGKAGVVTMVMPDTNTTLNVGYGSSTQVVLTSTTSATWTVPGNVYRIQVEMVGGGGAGGYAPGSDAGGGGGGAGQYIRGNLIVTPGTNITYVVGTGTPSVTSAVTGAVGGSTTLTYNSVTVTANGGTSSSYSANNNPRYGGLGGSGTTSAASLFSDYVEIVGGDGQTSSASSLGGGGGTGGASYFGGGGSGGGVRGIEQNWLSPQNGKVYGSGGGGGVWLIGASATAKVSGAGANGVIILTYFSQAQLPNTYTPVAPLSFSGSNLQLTASAYKTLTVIGSSPTTGTGVRSVIQSYARGGTTAYWRQGQESTGGVDYVSITIPSSLQQRQVWTGHGSFYLGVLSASYIRLMLKVYSGSSGSGTLLYDAESGFYASQAAIAYHLPINFISEITPQTVSVYIGARSTDSAGTTNTGSINMDGGHSCILLCTPQ
jgi:hypothetical protein